MTDIKAADLPEGSVVANERHAWVKSHPSAHSQWRGTSGGYYPDELVDKELAAGAMVLREGQG